MVPAAPPSLQAPKLLPLFTWLRLLVLLCLTFGFFLLLWAPEAVALGDDLGRFIYPLLWIGWNAWGLVATDKMQALVLIADVVALHQGNPMRQKSIRAAIPHVRFFLSWMGVEISDWGFFAAVVQSDKVEALFVLGNVYVFNTPMQATLQDLLAISFRQ